MRKWKYRKVKGTSPVRDNRNRTVVIAICPKCHRRHPEDLIAKLVEYLLGTPLPGDYTLSILCPTCSTELGVAGQFIEKQTEESQEQMLERLGLSEETAHHFEEEE